MGRRQGGAIREAECCPVANKFESYLRVVEMKVLHWTIDITSKFRIRSDDIRNKFGWTFPVGKKTDWIKHRRVWKEPWTTF